MTVKSIFGECARTHSGSFQTLFYKKLLVQYTFFYKKLR